MALTRSFIRNAAMTPLDARLANMASVVADADGTPRAGVLGSPTNLVVAAGSLNVSVLAAEFATTKGKGDGVAIFTNDGTVVVAIPAAPVSNSRIDTIWVKHNDNTTGDANSLPVFGVTSGTAAATPVAPALSSGQLELAQLRIYAGTTATNAAPNVITQTYQRTASRGAPVTFRTKTELDLWTTAPAGQPAIVLAERGLTYSWTGTAWIQTRIFAQAKGITTIPGSAEVTINFPAGLFTVPPHLEPVAIGGNGSQVATAHVGTVASQITATSFKVRIFSTGGTSVGGLLHWTATQMTPTAAVGSVG